MDAIREAESWQNLPVYALGASSGGAFALLLPFHMQLQVCPEPNVRLGSNKPTAYIG